MNASVDPVNDDGLPDALPGAWRQGAGRSDCLQGRDARGDGAADPSAPAARGGFRFLILGEIANFAVLRRHLGLARADGLVLDVAAEVPAILPGARVRAIGRAMIEIALEGDGAADASRALDGLRERFARPLDLDGEAHLVRMSFGLAFAPGPCDGVRLAECAETALALARSKGEDVVRELNRPAREFDALALKRELSSAIAAGEMFLHYQPKVHVRRQEVTSAEALVRWQHPAHGLIMPGDFIGLAEETGEIVPLTLWTLRQAIADQATIRASGHELTVFINISARLLADTGFVKEACALLREAGTGIGLEITETAVIHDPECAIRHLKQFAEIGIPISIDDYGAGLSSLAYLKQLPATELKIDKMFVMQLTSSNRDPLIVRSTIDLAHALEMEVVAEGVETPAALALLSVMGCDMVQGYLISRPVSLDAFCQFLVEERHRPVVTTPRIPFHQREAFFKRA